jgi:hypothetical protein
VTGMPLAGLAVTLYPITKAFHQGFHQFTKAFIGVIYSEKINYFLK